jgi:hypothetical protein
MLAFLLISAVPGNADEPSPPGQPTAPVGQPAAAVPSVPAAGTPPAPAVALAPDAPAPLSTTPGATGPAKPVIETPVNDVVRFLDTAQAFDRPEKDGEPLGRIRAGVRLRAIGIVIGGAWVQIELPNGNTAYVRRSATALDANGKPLNEVEKITGAVSAVPNAATLIVGDRQVRLVGLDPGPASTLGPFETWTKGRGLLECEPAVVTGAYRCFTSNGVDVGEAALLNGAARVGDGASALYREREMTAREEKRGLWGQP